MYQKYKFIIVGSGAGGATLARELTKKNKKVLVVEKGKPETSLGTFQDAVRFYEGNKLTKLPGKSKEGVILWRTFQSGGATVVSCGNGVRALEKEFTDLGIDLSAEFAEAEKETRTAPIAEKLLSEGSQVIRQAARDLGYRMDLMPKFIDPDKCQKCSLCCFGCAHGAKWTAEEYISEAIKNKADIAFETSVEKVLITNGKIKGVSIIGSRGQQEILADIVIISAGGLGSPVILQNSGIGEAGPGLFMDLLVNTYGITKDTNLLHEPTMALVNLEFHKSKGFLLSPFINASKGVRFAELGLRGSTMPVNKMLGIMTKITDDATGTVYPDGKVSKLVTKNDEARLNEGSTMSKNILIKAGADPKSIVVSKVQGAHPGGTAAIGKVVDKDLQTKVDGLFVCDSSVFPVTPGLPPILTIIALAKRLAKLVGAQV
jgi:choline dehydrogenase-like flavoprotein